MTKREVNLAIFEGTTDKVLWQPRLEMWINHHTQRGTLPERFKGMGRFEIYDALGCSVRYGAGVGVDCSLNVCNSWLKNSLQFLDFVLAINSALH